tara:strand:+ start:172 stop:777 length:606 start_codon:yes stop_codon:yes gene_type:complete
MQSLFSFIVKPINKRYDNEVKIGDKTLITNSRIESWKSVSNQAIVVETPKAFTTKIQKGDIVVIHHNVFRRFYDMRGKQKDSRSKFIDDKFFCDIDQVYLYKQNGEWNAFGDRCFISSIVDSDVLTADKERKLIGILKYGNSSLEAIEINPGDLVGYTPNGEFEFVIDNERLYCMKSNDIVIKYELKGNEIKYNPSWASGS